MNRTTLREINTLLAKTNRFLLSLTGEPKAREVLYIKGKVAKVGLYKHFAHGKVSH